MSLLASIEEALDLLQGQSGLPAGVIDQDIPLPSLLEQCNALCASDDTEGNPVRLIHHFACTGGTLISKCIAALPNVVLLSEIDPLSTLHFFGPDAKAPQKPRPFFPTDMIADIRFCPRELPPDTIPEMFTAGLGALRTTLARTGTRIVLRDHTHSHFCTGTDPKTRPTLEGIVSNRFPVRQVITVRHPLESFVSLDRNGWHHFQPFTLEEYARRYTLFLDSYPRTQILKYEDFVADPEAVLADICHILGLPYREGMEELISLMLLSGDSGRKSSRIEARPAKAVPEEIRVQTRASRRYELLCRRLNYPLD